MCIDVDLMLQENIKQIQDLDNREISTVDKLNYFLINLNGQCTFHSRFQKVDQQNSIQDLEFSNEEDEDNNPTGGYDQVES